MFKSVVSVLCLGFSFLQAGIFPEYDSNCDCMRCHLAVIDSSDYFLQEVPKNVHQIWFGDPTRVNRTKINFWRQFCEKFGYTYKLWTEQDDEELRSFMLPQNFELMLEMRARRDWWAASDIVRYELMKHFGGVYIDCDFLPPSKNNEIIDLQSVVNFHGLTLMTERYGRNIGTNAALFAANGFIVSCPSHPVINSVVEQIYENTKYWGEKCGNPDSHHCTGAFLLNKVLNGCFNIVPHTFLQSYCMDDTNWILDK
jgi:hypothetical protein